MPEIAHGGGLEFAHSNMPPVPNPRRRRSTPSKVQGLEACPLLQSRRCFAASLTTIRTLRAIHAYRMAKPFWSRPNQSAHMPGFGREISGLRQGAFTAKVSGSTHVVDSLGSRQASIRLRAALSRPFDPRTAASSYSKWLRLLTLARTRLGRRPTRDAGAGRGSTRGFRHRSAA